MTEKLKLSHVGKLIDYNPSDTETDFRCGNNMFSDDIWDFKGFIDAPSNWNDAKFRLDFTVFNAWPSIKKTVKWYMVSELLGVVYNSVRRKLSAFKQLRNYLNENHHITSFADFNKQSLRDFFNYVINAQKVNGQPLSSVSKKKAGQVMKELLIRGATKEWEVPKNTSYIEAMYQDMIIGNRDIQKDTKFSKTNKVLPKKEVINNLIKTAQDALTKGTEKDLLTAASILLTSQLGVRINELLSIETGCLSIVNSEFFITYVTSKTEQERIKVTKPANAIVVDTINKLEEYATPLREESGLRYLFLTRNRSIVGYPVCVASDSNWSKNRLTPFIKKYNLINEKGEPLKLTSHFFRHIFATEALKSGMKIHNLAEMMNHKSLSMTMVYDHSDEEKQEVVKDILSGQTPVSTTNKIVLESIESNENPFKGKTIDQIEKLRRAMKIEILPHGMCLHHPMRGEPCEQDGACLGCGNFLATAKHLPIYEKRLKRVNKELKSHPDDSSIYNTKLQYQKDKLENYVFELNKKLADKEFQQTLSEVRVDEFD